MVTKPYLGDGSFADYVTVATGVGLAKLPDEIDFAEGAALGLAATAAIQALDATEIQPGHKVLVVGATGGVGNQAVQLAALKGAHVVATAATDDERALVTDLGATAAVDYTGDLTAGVRQADPDGVDVVLHFAGDPHLALASVRPGGRLASTLIMSPEQLPTDDATVHAIYAHPDADTLERAARHLAGGDTRVHVQQTFTLEQVPAAFEAFAAGTLGKLVVTIV